MSLRIGDKAPNFVLKDQNENEISLNQFRGHKVLLAFYPFDWSPVCTEEMEDFSKGLDKLENAGVKLLAISVDSIWSHRAFSGKLGLRFPLLSDFVRDVSAAYGILRPEGFANRAYFIIDEHGIIKFKQVMSTPQEKLDNITLLQAIRNIW